MVPYNVESFVLLLQGLLIMMMMMMMMMFSCHKETYDWTCGRIRIFIDCHNVSFGDW